MIESLIMTSKNWIVLLRVFLKGVLYTYWIVLNIASPNNTDSMANTGILFHTTVINKSQYDVMKSGLPESVKVCRKTFDRTGNNSRGWISVDYNT